MLKRRADFDRGLHLAHWVIVVNGHEVACPVDNSQVYRLQLDPKWLEQPGVAKEANTWWERMHFEDLVT